MIPLVSVITPTWQRHELLARCVRSVQDQTYPYVEHVVVSDGPDPELLAKRCPPGVVFAELEEHDPEKHWGASARWRGLELASGDIIMYCDDDDALRPEAAELFAAALEEHPEAGFALSRMAVHLRGGFPYHMNLHTSVVRPEVTGPGCLKAGTVGTPMVCHRAGLEPKPWRFSSHVEDWEMVHKFERAGHSYVLVDAETVDVWPNGGT